MASVPGRMEQINFGQDFTAIVDFAHTPNALASALENCQTDYVWTSGLPYLALPGFKTGKKDG